MVGELDLAKPKTEGADCVAIGDKEIFEKLNKQYKAESEDSLLYTIFGQQLAQPYSPPRSLLISTYE